MSWPVSKLDLINQQLALTADNPVAAADDGSDEWNVCSAAYEQAVEYMLDNHDWKQITTVAVLPPSPTPPTDDQFDTAVPKPADCIHVIWVRVNDRPTVYEILTNQIVFNQYGEQAGDPIPQGATPGTVTVKYVSSSPPGIGSGEVAAAMTRTFMTALGRFVMAGIYRGLHEDIPTARAEEQVARMLLAEARARSDAEQGRRAAFNSRLTASRRVRRPFPRTPSGWGGSGIPG